MKLQRLMVQPFAFIGIAVLGMGLPMRAWAHTCTADQGSGDRVGSPVGLDFASSTSALTLSGGTGASVNGTVTVQGTTTGRRRAVEPGLPPGTPVRNSAQALETVAKITYDALAAKEDLKPYIDGIMTAFGVPPLGEADASWAGIRYGDGLPLMFIPQVAEMADAFNDGGFVSLDSFIAAANDRGAKQKATNNPLTREYLSQVFAAYTGKVQYGPGQVLPAFVLALGRERARRSPPRNPDALWGDGLLDPLQLTLLLYSVSYAGAGPLPPQLTMTSQDMSSSSVNDRITASRIPGIAGGGPIGAVIADAVQDQVTGEVQDAVGIPLDKKEAAQVSVCASLQLYGHKLKVKATPNLIYHKDGEKPSSTRADATLTFEDDYWDNYAPIDRWMLENLGNCKLPRRGSVGGKPLEWSVSDGLAAHGNYDVKSSQTDDDGHGFATWRTVDETTPKALRTFSNQRDAVGALIVRAGSLVPGWSGLERVVGALKDTGNTGDSPLTVIYYIRAESWTGTGSGRLRTVFRRQQGNSWR